MLAVLDPGYAAELDARNYRYVMRGLEVFRATGKSKKSDNRLGEGEYDTFFVTPFDGDRAGLYERINERVLGMFKQGLVEEVTSLIQNTKYKIQSEGSVFSTLEILEKLPGLNAIGYREVIDFLTGIKTLSEAIEAVQTNSRHYAKRQLTWFRRYQTEKIDGFFGA
jgi:tRNA dimethylallyltransferase